MSGNRRSNATTFGRDLTSRGLPLGDGVRAGASFRASRLVSDSGGSLVYEGRDEAGDSPVVLQVYSREHFSAGMLTRLQVEAETLHRAFQAFPGAILHVERQGDRLVLVRQHVAGETLADRLLNGPLSVLETLRLGCQLLSLLADWHALRVLHRNLRPASIFVTPAPQPAELQALVDFGPPPAMSTDAAQREKMLEFAQYLSPEMAGTLDSDISDLADLYALGAVLFHCLVGRPPQVGQTTGEIFLARMTSEPPSPRTYEPTVPRALDELVRRLLQPNPRERYQSASAALLDLQAIEQQLLDGTSEPIVIVGASDRRASLTEAAFVARTEELQHFQFFLNQLSEGHGGLVFVEAESGCGKSRLIAEASRYAMSRGIRVFRGQGTSDVVQRPFGLLEGVVNGLMNEASDTSVGGETFWQRVDKEFVTAIQTALPALRDLVGPGENGDSEHPASTSEARTVHALSKFLGALGTPDRPALVVLDDSQWGDDLTFKLLRRWQREANERKQSGCHVLVVSAFRSEEVDTDHPLRRITPDDFIALEPLSPVEVRQLLESMAGALPDSVIQPIVKLAEGSPFMASAILRGLVESQALRAEATGWVLEESAAVTLQSSEHAADLLANRLSLLPPKTLSLLSAGAILGKEFDLEIASILSSGDQASAISEIDEARHRRLVWMKQDGGQYVFVHDKIRAAVLDRLPLDERQHLHRQAAAYFVRQPYARSEDLAYHYDAAGDSQAALPFALKAAEESLRRHALEVAEQQYRIAERGASTLGASLRFQIAEGLGETLMLLGRYADASVVFEQAATWAETEQARAIIRGKIGELRFKRGDMEQALNDYESALLLLNRRVPRRRWIMMLSLFWELIVQGAHTVLPGVFLGAAGREPSSEERLALRLYSNYAHGCWYCRDLFITLWAHLRGLNAAERYLPSHELANAYAEHAPALTLVSWFSRAARYAEKSRLIRVKLGDLWGQGHSAHYHGIVLYAASRFEECIVKCREAVRLLEKTGDYWQVHIARYQIAASLYRLGDLAGAMEEAQINYLSGLELGDEQASAINLDIWARIVPSGVPDEILQQEFTRSRRDAQGTTQLMFARGVSELKSSKVSEAAKTLSEAMTIAESAGVRNPYTAPVYPWLAMAWRLLAEGSKDISPRARLQYRRRAWSALRKGWWLSFLCRNDLPRLYREMGILAASQGYLSLARKLLNRSVKEARRQGVREELCLSLQVHSRLGREVGWKNSEEYQAESEQLWLELEQHRSATTTRSGGEQVPSLSLLDRFDTLLTAGRELASALSRESVHALARSSAMRLLRAEQCFVGIPNAGSDRFDWGIFTEAATKLVDKELLQRAISVGHAVTNAAQSNTGYLARPQSNRGSHLCVPLYVRHKLVAVLYATHERIEGLFGHEEERLADFVTAIAGAALENAEGFEQLQQLNSTLESRVRERTAAAESRSEQLSRSNRALERIANELRHAQDDLQTAKLAAEAASAAKSRFLATMSHEIRTPMNGVIGMTELALATTLTDQQKNYLTVVKESAHSLLSLLNDILDFSKIEAGHMELERLPFSVVDAVYDACRLLSVNASRKGLDLVCHVPIDVSSELIGDPGRIRQIVVNLVGNALKFTEKGGVTVTVDEESISSDVSQLHIVVADTGIGIPQDKQQAIFEAFRQSDSSITRRFGGTGLGLSISSQLCAMMGGKIWVESEPGRGSQFHVTLPLERPTDLTPLREFDTELLTRPAVLVVAKDDVARRSHTELLESAGCRVESMTSPQEVVMAVMSRALSSDKPALVLIEARPGEQELLELAVRMGGPSFGLNLPILLLTPAGLTDAVEMCGQLKTITLLTKPAKPHEIVSALRRQLKHGDTCEEAGVNDEAVASTTRSLRILLADDSPVNLEVATGLLELEGHVVTAVDDGQAAVEAWETDDFDVLLLDLEMPRLDGLSATRKIRELEAAMNCDRPAWIYAMTAHAVQGYRETCEEAGMNGFITKPIQPDELREALEQVAAAIQSEAEV